MITMEYGLLGHERLIAKVDTISHRLRLDLEGAVREYGQLIVKEAHYSMAEPKSGIHHPGNPRRSSAPGQSPAIQTGTLANSITSVMMFEDAGYVTKARVGPHVHLSGFDYAKHLELKMNRAFLRPAYWAVEGAFRSRVYRIVKEAIR